MDALVPMMIQDPFVAQVKGMDRLTEGFLVQDEDFFLDGPVTSRVAVLDLDADTGDLYPGAPFVPPKPGGKQGTYALEDPKDIEARDFARVSVFATVMRTLAMFEKEDCLGREVSWAFEGPQLLVVPRAGEWANAFYERESRSLQLFSFQTGGTWIHTSLSRDIVGHETGHAILDGIAPALYHAITPQSLAIHEAIADMSALFLSFQSRHLVDAVLRQTNGSIRDSTAFNSIAEEFGRALDPQGRSHYLRSLLNQKTLDPNDTSQDDQGRPNRVSRDEPHALSEVLSGALYRVVVRLHEDLAQQYSSEQPDVVAASGKALGIGGARLRRMFLRALEYLPPGEVSFADYGRAVLAADQASHPEDDRERAWLREELVRRHMAPDAEALEVETDREEPALREIDLRAIVDSDWAAYDFVGRNRSLLGIPDEVPFRVLPRLESRKTYYHRDGEREVHECILKVAWDHTEPNRLGRAYPQERSISVGTTLAIDWDSRRLRSRLTTDVSEEQQLDRDRMLLRMDDEGILLLDRRGLGPDREPLRSAVRGESLGDVMRVRGGARMLHLLPLAP
jgi:hypothetical protein